MNIHESDQNCGLCIGGPYDGRWICDVGTRTSVIELEHSSSFAPGEPDKPTRRRHVVYLFKPFHSDDGRKIGMWIVEGRSAYDAMNALVSVYLNLVGTPEIDDGEYDALAELIDKHAPQLHGCAKGELRHQIITNWLPAVVAKALARGAGDE